MRDIASRITAFVAIMVLILMQALPSALAQTPLPAPQQLDQLLAPIALYPDSLLAQITTAATNPREILDVDNWLASYPRLSDAVLSDAAQQQGFDAAFISLVHFPEVLQMMAENIDDYAAIGDAVLADQAAVSASVQRLRAPAYASGALRSTAQQVVALQQVRGQTYYIIEPANLGSSMFLSMIPLWSMSGRIGVRFDDIDDQLWSWHRYRGIDCRRSVMGMGRLGMELG